MHASQVRAARGLLRWSQADLAEKSGVSVPTIKRLEAMDGEMTANATTMGALERAFTEAGVALLAPGESLGGGVGVRLKE